MMIEPTYLVRWTDDPRAVWQQLRVPRPNVEAVLHVLLFNGAAQITCVREGCDAIS